MRVRILTAAAPAPTPAAVARDPDLAGGSVLVKRFHRAVRDGAGPG